MPKETAGAHGSVLLQQHGVILQQERQNLQRGRISFWEDIGSSLGREAGVSARQEAADVEVPAGWDYEWPEVPSSHTEPSSPCPALPEVSTGQTFAPHITNSFKRAAGSLVPEDKLLFVARLALGVQKLAAISAVRLPGSFWSLLCSKISPLMGENQDHPVLRH